MTGAADALDVAFLVAQALESAGVDYFLGGSMASSIQGEPRATNDIDFVVDLDAASLPKLIGSFGPEFVVDVDTLREAVRRRSSCQVYYLELVTKIDLFVLQEAPFDRSEFARRKPVLIRDDRFLVVKTPEDTVLRKLLWYVEGGAVSEKQWRDVVQVLRVSRAVLDDGYLDEWAKRLALDELLSRARLAAQ